MIKLGYTLHAPLPFFQLYNLFKVHITWVNRTKLRKRKKRKWSLFHVEVKVFQGKTAARHSRTLRVLNLADFKSFFFFLFTRVYLSDYSFISIGPKCKIYKPKSWLPTTPLQGRQCCCYGVSVQVLQTSAAPGEAENNHKELAIFFPHHQLAE